MLDVHRLRILRTVVALGSVGGAANALGYTPSAVSQQLTALQHQTGLRLIERKGRGIEPTPTGRTLAAEAERVLESLNRVDGLVRDLRAGRAGSLSISYFASAGAAWIPPVVGELIKEFPDLRPDLRLVELLGDHGSGPDLDVFVGPSDRSRHNTRVDGGYHVHHLIDDPYVAVLPVGHPLADRPQVELAELAAERWVDNDFSHGICRQVLMDACTEAGFTPDFRIETHDYPTALSFVATGIGVTVLPALGVESYPFGVAVVPVVNPTPVRHIFVAVKASVERHPAAVRALELLRKRVSQGRSPV